MRAVPASERGLSILEATLMLTISLAIIGGLVPTLAATIRNARTARATTDMTTLATQVQQMLNDLFFVEYRQNGSGAGGGGMKVQLLVTDGDMPACATAGAPCVLNGVDSWNRLVNLTTVDFIENHVVRNMPGANVANDYPIPGWKGPYLNSPVDPDPWGNRYAVNADEFNTANNVHVISAGPDETISSAWAGTPLVAVDDDLVALVQP